jgi:hypothetical protein
MAEKSRVHSIDAVRDVRGALVEFGEEAAGALGSAEMEIRRTQAWLDHEQEQFWKGQIRARQEEVALARSELARKRLRDSPDFPVDLEEEKKRLRRAQGRLEEAEEKLEAVRRWRAIVQKAVLEYEGIARQLANLLELDVPRAVGSLDKMIESLEAYVSLAPPTSGAEEAPSMARPEDQPALSRPASAKPPRIASTGETEEEKTEPA